MGNRKCNLLGATFQVKTPFPFKNVHLHCLVVNINVYKSNKKLLLIGGFISNSISQISIVLHDNAMRYQIVYILCKKG